MKECPYEHGGRCTMQGLHKFCRGNCKLTLPEKVCKRLKSLPQLEQYHIADKYYSGIVVWDDKA